MNIQILGHDISFRDFWHYTTFYSRINDALEACRMCEGMAQQKAHQNLISERENYQKYLDEIKAKYPAEVIEAIEEQVRNG